MGVIRVFTYHGSIPKHPKAVEQCAGPPQAERQARRARTGSGAGSGVVATGRNAIDTQRARHRR